MTDFKGYTKEEVEKFTLVSVDRDDSGDKCWVRINGMRPNGEPTIIIDMSESSFMKKFYSAFIRPNVQEDITQP